MNLQQSSFEYEEYQSSDELNDADKSLLEKARAITQSAYAPYSNFKVGCAAKLIAGQIITATNQENASSPAGICAERNLLAVAASLYGNVAIEAIAISYQNERGESLQPISPCGICRQSLLEYEQRMKQNIRIILGGQSGKIFVLPSSKLLLPLAFSADDLG